MFLSKTICIFALLSLGAATAAIAQSESTPTTITIDSTVQRTGVKRLGINLSNQTYFDSRQMMSNLVFRNPGFEGEIWQSVIHCKVVDVNSCTDDKASSAWPADFFKGATVEFLTGAETGTTTTVVTNAAPVAASGLGVQLTFSSNVTPAVGDYLAVRMSVPGNAPAGWSTRVTGTGTISTELQDLSPSTTGKQAIRLTAPTDSSAIVTSYFDSGTRAFLSMNGTFTLTFRAKLISGIAPLTVSLSRVGVKNFLQQTVDLTGGWQDFSYTFDATEPGAAGTIQLAFNATNGTVLLDDVCLSKNRAADNPTAFRDEVVDTLRTLAPGEIRYMDNGLAWGSSLDNMLVPSLGRQRTGYSNWATESDDIPIGLHDFLVLCQTVGAEPWFTMPAGMSVDEMNNMMDYLGGASTTVYGARRIALGQSAPWTSVFSAIHLEFGNEVWNTANPGASFTDPAAYGTRAGMIFTAAKASPSYSKVIDLVVDGWESAPSWTKPVLAASQNYDTISQAAYFYGPFTDDSSNEAIFGSMFSIPEQVNSRAGGLMVTRVAEAQAATHPARTAVYEANLGAITGTVPQSTLNNSISSTGAGIAAVDNLLLMIRDLGIVDVNTYSLGQFGVQFINSASSASETTPIYGTVVDMDGIHNLRRPSFLAQQLANQAIRSTMLTTTANGANPTWDQSATNGAVAISGVHYLQSFAFTDGTNNSVILLNLSRTTALPVQFTGANAPTGNVAVSTLTSSEITDVNELSALVNIQPSSLSDFSPAQGMTLPPFSMTVLTYAAPPIASISVRCDAISIKAGATMQCDSAMTGSAAVQGAVTWTASAGTIDSNGIYTAPTNIVQTQAVTITATSTLDTKKVATQTIQAIPITTVTSVTVSCVSGAIAPQTNTACSAAVAGTGNPTTDVLWAISGGAITSAGVVTAPSTLGNLTVTATSVQDPTKVGTYTLAVSSLPILSNPTAVVTDTSATVSWQANVPTRAGMNYGTNYSQVVIDQTKFVTGPAFTLTGLTPSTTYKILLFGYSETSAFGSLMYSFTTPPNGLTVTMSCAYAAVIVKGTVTCSANTSDKSPVTWSTTVGTVTQAGVVTAPSTAGTLVVTATSTMDTTKSASFALNVVTAPIFGNVVMTPISNTSVTLSWQTNMPVNPGVDYGPNYSTTIMLPPTQYTSTPSLTLTNLQPNTTYKAVLFGYSTTRVFGAILYTFKTNP